MHRCAIALFLLGLAYLPALAIPAVVPVPRHGVVLDSSTGEPIADVLITVRELPDTIGNCIETDTHSITTNASGEFVLKLGCAADLTFAKAGYNTATLRWPRQLAASEDYGCCPDLRPVKLLKTSHDSPPDWQQSFGYSPAEIHAIEIGEFGYPYVPVNIGGDTIALAFDTGNMVGISLNTALFDRLGITEVGTVDRLSGSGEVVETSRIGQSKMVVVLGYDLGMKKIYELNHTTLTGLVGPDFLDGAHFTLDYRARQMAAAFSPLGDKIDGYHAVPLVRSVSHPTLILVRGTVEGREILIELDTGKSRTVINPELASMLKLDKGERGVRIGNFQIGKISFEIPSAKEVDQTDIETGSAERILAGVGSDVLSQIVWTVDYKSGVLWLPDSR
jgi:hypothetical protein